MRDVWDEIWKTDAWADPSIRAARATRRIDAISRVLGDHAHLGRVIELGCGDGSFAMGIARTSNWTVQEYVGFDRSPTAISRAKAKGIARDSRYRFNSADIEGLQLDNESADTIFALGVLEHIEQPDDVLRKIRAASKPNGKLIITTSNLLSLMYMARLARQAIGRWPYGYQKNYTPAQLRLLLQPEFRLAHCSVMHGDWDFPLATAIDRALHVLNANFGRYILAVAQPN